MFLLPLPARLMHTPQPARPTPLCLSQMAACNTRAVHDLQSETCRELLAGKVLKQPSVSFQPSEILAAAAAAAAAEAIDGEGAQALSESAED